MPGSRLTWRKLLVLLHHLPPESAMNTAIRNDTPERELDEASGDSATFKWSTAELLLASVIDELRNLRWIYAQSHSEKTIPKPEPVRRPGIRSGSQRKRMSLEEAQRIDPRLRGLSAAEAQEVLDRIHGG